MTQKSFIQYLHDELCEVSQDHSGKFYRVRKREGGKPWMKTVMPLNNFGNVKLMTICLICHHLDIVKPQEVREYNDQFFEPIIVKNHLKKQFLN